jgi:hypothetical protein
LVYNLVSTGSSGGTGGTIIGLQTNSSTFTATIRENKVYDLSSTSTGVVVSGIYTSSGTTTTIQNNLVGDLKAPAANVSNAVIGINVAGGTTVNVYYNTVSITGSSTGAVFGTSAIFASTGTTLNMNNNIFVNNATSNGAGLTVAYRRSSTTLTSYGSGSNRNDFFAPVIFNDGTNTDLTIGAYQTRVSTRDANSLNVNPVFTSTVGSNAGFLHINTSFPTALESGGANIGSITIDYDGNTRQGNAGYTGTGTAPDIGADEFELAVVNCSSANGGTISPASATNCAGTTRTITTTGATSENGISYQWKVSTTAGGPYSNVSGGSGATTASYTTGTLTAGTYYYVLEATCSFGSIVGLSNEYTLTVNPIPVVSVTPATSTFCSPGGSAVALTASGASTYVWSPATGLSATTGATVNASPSSTSTYSVIGSALGCVSAPVNAVVNVAAMPQFASVTATPATVCSGSNSQLVANATVAYNNTAAAYSFAGSTGTYTAVTGTTLGASAIGDDVGIGNLPIGFTFPYNGSTFTVFGARSNGLIELGQTAATLSGFSANSLSGNANCIAPLWDDNNTTGGSIIYTTTGTAPNRVLTVQWTGMHVAGGGSSTNPTIDCQIRLYETSGVIELVYGSTSAALSSPTASIGISGAAGNYLSVTPLLPANTSTVSSSTENSVTSSTNFPSGTIYTFTPPVPPALTYAWSPVTNLSSSSIANPIANGVTSPITYNVSVTAPNGCVNNTGTVSLTVNSLPSSPTAINSAQCGAQVPTASVTSTTGQSTPTFVWYNAPTAGSLMQSSTSVTYTSNVSSTTTFYVAEVSGATGCESNRTPVTVTVAAADAILATVNNATICIGSSIILTASNTNSTPNQSYTYSWSGTAGSGLSSAAGTPVTVTPTAPGTYTYSLTGVDGSCNAISSVNVTVDPFAVALSPVNVTCNGYNNGSFTHGTTTCGTAPYTYSVDGGAFVGTIPTNLTPGTHTVVVMNSLGFTTVSQNITITEPSTTISTPTGTGATVCQNASSAMVSASSSTNVIGAPVTVVIPFNVATQPTEVSANTVPTVAASPNVISTAVMAALPAGSVITSATLNYNGIQATGSSWMSDVRLGLSGAATQPYTAGTGSTNSAGTFNYTATVPPASVNVAGGSISLHYFDYFNDNTGSESTFPTGAGVVNLTIVYTPPINASISWWNASTGGTQIGTGSPFQTVGTSVLPNTNTPGVYTLYAQGEYNSCSGTARTPVTVTVKPISTSLTTVSACVTYTWNGTTYTSSGTYTHTLTNSVGCDSIATLNLTIKNNTSSSSSVSACSTYTWPVNGATYTTSGTHTATIPNAAGCDSIITLNLTINVPTAATVSQSACNSYTWPINGQTYTTSGTHTATISNAAGCDSVITLNLTINTPTTGTDVQSACGSYTWIDGVTYTASNNTATFTIAGGNSNGCDSVVTLNLTINNPTTGTDVQSACGSYTWIDGVTYTASNNTATFTIVGGNSNGCDSIITLDLTILQPATSSVPVTECTLYTWPESGMTYTTSGTYTHTLLGAAANGCDSIITLNLTIIQPTTSSVSATACSSYTWAQNGMTYTASGAYTDTIPNASGCDSVITLNLTISMPTSSVFTVSTCSPSYTWAQNGMTYTASGMYNDTVTNAAGCDSVVTLNLTITTFVATATDNGNATATASAGTTYQWINCATNTPIAGATAQTFAPTANGSYAVIVSNGTCSDTSNCVNITNVGIKENTISTIEVHPNPTHDVVFVTMDASSAVVEVMDAQGKLVQTTQIKSGDQVDLSAYERGVYTLRIKTDLGTSIERIVKN